MIDPLVTQLEREIGEASKWQNSYDSLLSGFFERKQAELYQVFQDLGTSDRDGLLAVKLQSNALKMLEDEFQHHINTGKMASKTLEDFYAAEKEKENG